MFTWDRAPSASLAIPAASRIGPLIVSSVVVRSTDEDLIDKLVDMVFQTAFELGGDPLFEEAS